MHGALFALVLTFAWLVVLVAVAVGVKLLSNRRLDHLTADDVLTDWEIQLALLEPEQRELARLSPPAEVVAAMVRRRPTGWLAALAPRR